jgi:hypothetical protein
LLLMFIITDIMTTTPSVALLDIINLAPVQLSLLQGLGGRSPRVVTNWLGSSRRTIEMVSSTLQHLIANLQFRHVTTVLRREVVVADCK